MRRTNKRPSPPLLHQQLACRARMVEEFARLIEELGWPAWRVEAERRLACGLWERALEERYREPVQLHLFYLVS